MRTLDLFTLLRVEWGEETLLVWVSQAPLAESPGQCWASGFRFLDSMLGFPTADDFFLSWLAFILHGELQRWDVGD